jgi:hypothetical protein
VANIPPLRVGLFVLLAVTVIASLAVVAGIVWVLTIGSLLGFLLITGGIAGLGWAYVPAVIGRMVRWLSIGR